MPSTKESGDKLDLKYRPISVDEMRSLEKRGEEIGVSRIAQMENAGSSIASYVFRKHAKTFDGTNGPKKGTTVAIIGGVGNNGGDAFVAARHLAYWRSAFRIFVFLVGSENEIRTNEARINWKILSFIPSVKRFVVDSPIEVTKMSAFLTEAELIIVGIFGTGFKGKPRELQRLVIDRVNQQVKTDVISVDIPSGLEADTGSCEYAVSSEVTITMHAPKMGMLSNPTARQKCGKIIVTNIGLPF